MSRPAERRVHVPFLLALYGVEGALLLIVLAAYKLSKGVPGTPLESLPARVLMVATVTAILALTTAIALGLRIRRKESRLLGLHLALNAFSVACALLAGEAVLRIAAVEARGETRVFGTELLPRSWSGFAEARRATLERAKAGHGWAGTYLIADPAIGWTVGPARNARDGMYASSLEGIRSATPGVRYEDPSDNRRTIAVVGDSYTFGMEVAYGDCWPTQLEELLGPGFRVLNFGVDGYGVDQAWLRYRRDVRRFDPELVLFGFINHDFARSLSVYSFLSFPEWDFPFAKSRFVLRNGELRPLRETVPAPEVCLRAERVSDLEWLDYEPGWRPWEWNRSVLDVSYVARLLASRFRPWPPPGEHVSPAARESLNVAILKQFLADAAADGCLARLCYFPSGGFGDLYDDVSAQGAAVRDDSAAPAILARAGLEFIDLADALHRVPPSRRRVRGGIHYTPEANREVARELRDRIAPLLTRR